MVQAIEVKDLTRLFGGKKTEPSVALDHLDLHVEEGELFGLLGPNGAGKTTLIKILSTLLLPSSGSAKVLGYDVVREAAKIRPRINMVSGGETSGYGLLTVREALIGLSLGLLSQVIFSAVEFCGQIIGTQMGFSAAAQFDPTMGTQVSIMSVFQNLLAILLFMTLGMHHVFIRAIVESYAVIPVGAWHMSGELLQFVIATTTGVFILGIKLAAPVMASLLAATVALGIMARSFPQMNIFMISFPLNIGLGFVVLGVTLLVFFRTLGHAFDSLGQQIGVLFRLLGG